MKRRFAMKIKPEVKIESLKMADPTFEGGEHKTARALLTNPTAKEFVYTVELYLGVGKAATSGTGDIAIAAGGSQYVDFGINMPVAEGSYPVYLDVSVAGALIKHYQATEDVVIEISPDISVGPITWE
jgi:hypothetical protein